MTRGIWASDCFILRAGETPIRIVGPIRAFSGATVHVSSNRERKSATPTLRAHPRGSFVNRRRANARPAGRAVFFQAGGAPPDTGC